MFSEIKTKSAKMATLLKEMRIAPLSYRMLCSAVFSRGTGGARAPPELEGSRKGRSLISAYQSLAITTKTPGFEKLNTALLGVRSPWS